MALQCRVDLAKRPQDFYRAMLYAQRGIATANRVSFCPSVCLSVCDVEVFWSYTSRLGYFEINRIKVNAAFNTSLVQISGRIGVEYGYVQSTKAIISLKLDKI